MDDMRRRIRKRTLKWAGLGLCSALAGMLIFGLFWNACYCGSNWAIGSANLTLHGSTFPNPDLLADASPGWHFGHVEGQPIWWPKLIRVTALKTLCIPIWMFLMPAATATAYLWYADRRPQIGGMNCGYNLTSNASGVCPECGAFLGE